MLDTTRHNKQFTLFKRHTVTILKFKPYFSVGYEKQFVGIVVMMPRELALDFGELDSLSIQLGGNVWFPMLVNRLECIRGIHFSYALSWIEFV